MTLCVVVEALLSGRMLRVVPLLSRHPTPREILIWDPRQTKRSVVPQANY